MGANTWTIVLAAQKVWQRCLEAEVRPSAPPVLKMAGVHLPGLGSKGERHSGATVNCWMLCARSSLAPHDALITVGYVPSPSPSPLRSRLLPCRSVAPALATATVNGNCQWQCQCPCQCQYPHAPMHAVLAAPSRLAQRRQKKFRRSDIRDLDLDLS